MKYKQSKNLNQMTSTISVTLFSDRNIVSLQICFSNHHMVASVKIDLQFFLPFLNMIYNFYPGFLHNHDLHHTNFRIVLFSSSWWRFLKILTHNHSTFTTLSPSNQYADISPIPITLVRIYSPWKTMDFFQYNFL